jgi:DNA replication and repair protein RecF
MAFSSIRVASFRNLEDAEIFVGADRVLLIGENGQGKTNFLEALYFLSFGTSFRGVSDQAVSRIGTSSFSLSGRFHETEDSPEQRISVQWDTQGKTIRIDDKIIRDRKELVNTNPAIIFCHEDFVFASGEPERRRFFFDQTAGLVSLGYIDTLREYKRTLKQRNAALKAAREDLLEVFDRQLAEKGLELMESRRRLESEISEKFSLRFEAVSLLGERVRIAYRSNWPQELTLDTVLERLRSKRNEELALGTSLSGPHRDRWSFVTDSSDFAAKASTGQLRLISLTLRMVQAEYYTERVGRRPVLLLDDVLLELDRARRRRFLDLLPAAAQAFFTFLPGESWEENRMGSSLVYEVKNGRITN